MVFGFQGITKAIYQSTNFGYQIADAIHLFIIEITQTSRNKNLRLGFLKRTSSDAEKVKEIFFAFSALTFGNVRGNRDGRFSQLGAQTVDFLSGKGSTDFVDQHNKIHGLLPNDQFPKMLDRHD